MFVRHSFVAHFFYDAGANRAIPLRVTLSGGVLSLMDPQLRYVAKGTSGSFVKYGLDAQEGQLAGAQPLPLNDPAYGVGGCSVPLQYVPRLTCLRTEDPSIHGTLTTGSGKRTIVSEKGN